MKFVFNEKYCIDNMYAIITQLMQLYGHDFHLYLMRQLLTVCTAIS